MSHYYLYMIKFETGQFYIGSRKSKVPASEDIKYWGSPGKINESLWDLEKEKHILFESTDISYKELTDKEKRLAKDYQLQRALDLLKGLSIFEESFE